MAVVLLAACATTRVETTQSYSGPKLPAPDRVLVHDFAFDADAVQVDASAAGHAPGAAPPSAEEVGQRAAKALSEALVRKLVALGLPASRTEGAAPATGNTVAIGGRFVAIDQGDRSERMTIGFGKGGSEVRTRVEMHELVDGERIALKSFLTTAKSADRSGPMETAAVLTTGDSPASAQSYGDVVGMAEEAESSSVVAEAERTATAVAKDLAPFFVEQGWVTQAAVKKALYTIDLDNFDQ